MIAALSTFRRGAWAKATCTLLGWIALSIGLADAQIYVVSGSSIGVYDPTTGSPLNPSLITGLNSPSGIAISGTNLYEGSSGGVIGEYNDQTGTAVNASLVSGLVSSKGIAISGSNLYAVNFNNESIGEYDANTGATINSSLVTGFTAPFGLAVASGDLYVVDSSTGKVGEYDATTGAVINASLVSGLTSPEGIAVSGSNLYVVSSGKVGEYDATTGAAINASLITGLTGAGYLAILGTNLYVVSSGKVGEYNATTGAAINASLITGLTSPTGIAAAFVTGSDVGDAIIDKIANYDQTAFTAPTLDPENGYQFIASYNSGSSGELLSYSTLTPPSGSSGAVSFQAGINGLTFQEDFQSQSQLDSAFADGTYNTTIQTTTPNTYPLTLSLNGDNYPPTPQLTSVTNATFTAGGYLLITNPAVATVFTWTPGFNSSNGSIFFEINNTPIGISLPADGTQTTFTVPANTFTANTAYTGSLQFSNFTPASNSFNINAGANYFTQLNFGVQVGTPVVTTPTFNIVIKEHVLVQSSTSAPVNGTGDIDYFDPAPYSFRSQNLTAGSVTGAAGTLTLRYHAGDSSRSGPFRFSSGPIPDQTTLDSIYPDGTYTLSDGSAHALTGDTYPNVPQVTQVNGATPTWNRSGQLILDPTVANTITWTAFNLPTTTFVTNGHESFGFQSENDNTVNVKQQTGLGEASTTAFNTVTIPANAMTANFTYVGDIEYVEGSSVSNPSANVYDVAGYGTETFFTAIATPPGSSPQTINFPAITPNQVVGTSITLVATSSSGLPVTFSIGSGPATLTGNVLNFTGTGTVVVFAKQAGNSIYAAATPVSQTFNVNTTSSGGVAQTITFPSLADPQNAAIPATLTATASSGLPVTYSIASGPATVSGNVVTFLGPGSVTINADQAGNGSFAAAPTASISFEVASPTDLGYYQIGKSVNYSQSSSAAPTLQPEGPYQFSCSATGGTGGRALSTSTLIPPASSTGSVFFQAGVTNLNFDQSFTTKAAMDAAFTTGAYQLTIQTDAPNTYRGTISLGSDNYPTVNPQVTSATNATWSGGHLVVTNPALPVVLTIPAFNSAIGGVFFSIDNTSINEGLAADGTTTTVTIPGNSLANNTLYHATLGFQNSITSSAIPSSSGATTFTSQVQFDVQVGTPTAPTATKYLVAKSHVQVQSSASAPVDGSGDKGGYDPAPYNIEFQSPVSGTTTAPSSTATTLLYDPFGGDSSMGSYRFTSGSVASQATLDSTYPNGTYALADGNTAALTGNGYPNVPQVTAVNGAAPVWNAAGQLVLDPSVANTLTWTAFSISAGTFASNGHESAEIYSDTDSSVDLKQKAGVTESSTVAFNTLTIPAGTLTNESTYVGDLEYFLGSSVNSPSVNVYDVAGYQSETFFTAVAAPLPSAFNPSFSSATDIGVTSNGYVATGAALTINLNFAPTAATTLTVINNTGSGPITGTFSNVAEGGTLSASFGGTTYTFTATYKGGDGNDMTLTYTPPLPPSSLTILHAFADGSVPNDGTDPLSNLIQGTDGNFYGTTFNGGSANAGSVFKITPRGQVTILHSFNDGTVPSDGTQPDCALMQASDGNFYGTTQNGGTASAGTVFKMTPQGQVTILHNFGDGSVTNDGAQPSSSLIQAADGNFYGTASGGGTSSQSGVFYKISLQGQVTIIHAFADGSVVYDGSLPDGPVIQAADGNFYGTTDKGGASGQGTVFKITPLGQTTVLHSFEDGSVSSDGANPQCGLVQGPDGNFYGTTSAGGVTTINPPGFGTIFKITPQGQLTILHVFDDGSVPNDAEIPFGGLILGIDGNYYGMSSEGGSGSAVQDFGSGAGAIFRVTPQGVVTILHSFKDGSVLQDGSDPSGGLVEGSDGTFYGTTFSGGTATNAGVVFKFSSNLPVITSALTANGTVGLPFSYQTLATNTPTSYTAMGLPAGLVINPATGLITGTPTTTGTSSVVVTASNSKGPSSVPLTITIVPLPLPVVTSILSAYGSVGASFSYQITATNLPTSYIATGLTGTGLSLNTTTGIISGTPTTPTTANNPLVVALSATNTVGTGYTVNLSIQITGTPPTVSQEYNVLKQFNGSFNDAASPTVIFQGFDGTFYGISSAGGSGSPGTAFNLTVQGTSDILHFFGSYGQTDGYTPQGLIQAADGNFYGTTNSGGSANLGTIFKFTPQGTETILHSFGDGSVTYDGVSPMTQGLIQGSDGNFYGTTQGGGSAGLGTVYKMTPLGVVTILHSFGDGSVTNDGASPRANLLQGADGNFYGTTQAGGDHSVGTIFKITPTGTLTIVHGFGDLTNDGANPVAALIQAPNGTFYGTTQNGGSHNTGTVFKMTTAYAVTIVHSFGDGSVANDGANPEAALTQGYDGNLYGTTFAGGSANMGTVFFLNTAGTETIIHPFGDGSVTNDGASPNAALYQDANGNFYGTTSSGGNGNGTVFTFVTTQPTTHVPVFTGAQSLFSPALTPLSFTPKALFGISSDGVTVSAIQASFLSQLIHTQFSQTSDWILTGTLPQFLTFDSTSGTISGTPIQAGTYTITMTAVNATGSGTPQTVTLYIDVAPTITSATSVTGTVGTPFTYQTVGTASPTSFGATGLPGWLSVDTTTGIISGTPPGAGTYVFSPTASNVSGTGTQAVTLTVTGGGSSPSITSATTAGGTVAVPFSYQITGTNTPTSFSAVTLPAGLVFDSNSGLISGTPTTDGTYLVPIGATNASGTTSSVLTITIGAVTAPVITSCSAITCSPSTVISYQITGTGSPKTFAAVGLPTGLSLNSSTGVITGEATSITTATVALSATNSVGTGTATLALTVTSAANVPTLTSPSIATGAATIPFTYQVAATDTPTSYDASGLPAGFSINPSTGLISGTSTAMGVYNVTLYITNSTLGTSTANLTLNFAAPTFTQWSSLYPTAGSATANPEKDGVPNLLKYLFDIDPVTPMKATDRAGLPTLNMMTSGGTSYLALTYRQYNLETGLNVSVLTSSDLVNWSTPTNSTTSQVGTDPTTGDAMMQIAVPVTSTKQFIRLNVTSP